VTATRTCDLDPFLSPVVAQIADLEQAGSAVEILVQALENYLSRLKAAICDDFTEIVEECCGATPTTPSFLDLTDTPDSYAGAAGYQVVVNGTETGLIFEPIEDLTGFFTTRWIFTFAVGNAGAGMQNIGTGVIAQSGTASTQVIATTNHLTSFYRTRYAAAVAGISGIRQTLATVFRGNSSPQGGFKCIWKWGTATAFNNQRSFVGLNANVNFANVNPSTLTNIFGVGYDQGGTTFNVLHNDNAGGATSVPLGANFPVNGTDVYELVISCSPSSSSIEYQLTNLTTGAIATGSINTELPVATTALTPIGWVSCPATNAAQIEFIHCYLETAG